MYGPFTIAIKYLRYLLTASNGKGHGIHSPFVFIFIEKVLNDKKPYSEYKKVEELRRVLVNSEEVLQVHDFGAGSVSGASSERKVSGIARLAAKPPKYAQLLFRMVRYYNPGDILELGTSLGITTAYLASANADNKVLSLEGSPEIAAKAKRNFELLQIDNIKIITGNFDDRLSSALSQMLKTGLIFFDGNHRYEPTIHYFKAAVSHKNEGSIFIFDDIHWSSEMEKAWEDIKNNPEVTCTIDLFFIGLVFFNKDFKQKQHFVIRF